MEGINGGIVVGLIVAVVEYVINSSQLPSLRRVLRRSRAVWEPQHRKLLQDIVYNSKTPQIITLEITETVFFGSSLQLFSQICDEIGLDATPVDIHDLNLASPRFHSGRSPSIQKKHTKEIKHIKETIQKQNRPRYVVLEMTQVSNIDASAARSCFLQLAKICSKSGIVLCACGANSRVDWILRSHDVTYSSEEEEILKRFMLDPLEDVNVSLPTGKLILFSSINECLELCENQLIYVYKHNNLREPPKLGSKGSKLDLLSGEDVEDDKTLLSVIFGRVLGIECNNEKSVLKYFDKGGSAEVDEIELDAGQKVFVEDETSDGFFVVLRGSVTIGRRSISRRSISLLVPEEETDSFDMTSYISVGGIFGYVDFAIQRQRSFTAGKSHSSSLPYYEMKRRITYVFSLFLIFFSVGRRWDYCCKNISS